MGKERLTLTKLVVLGLALLLAAMSPMPSGAATTTLTTAYAVDPLTGAALEGYDAVSYFTDKTPLLGRPEFEHYWAGVPWYFSSAANRDVFMRSPETYAPMFGGYATMSVARGYLSVGNPRIYAILVNRLFLFYSSGNKDAFLISPRDAYQKAQEHWAVLRKDAGL